MKGRYNNSYLRFIICNKFDLLDHEDECQILGFLVLGLHAFRNELLHPTIQGISKSLNLLSQVVFLLQAERQLEREWSPVY